MKDVLGMQDVLDGLAKLADNTVILPSALVNVIDEFYSLKQEYLPDAEAPDTLEKLAFQIDVILKESAGDDDG